MRSWSRWPSRAARCWAATSGISERSRRTPTGSASTASSPGVSLRVHRRRERRSFMAEQIRDLAEADPDRAAIIDEFAELTRAELNARVNRLANGLRAAGLG